jgi:2-polyprenyl-3-methyl-5-hydroxy-6-metoxy-1,4-benzoquinol methylase
MPTKFDETYWKFVQAKFKGGYNFDDLIPVLKRYIDWIKKYFDRSVRVLDLGCGFGYFLRLCDEQSWDTYGVDVSSFAIDMARTNTKARLYLHNIEKLDEPIFAENAFDLITMFDVIEHLTLPNGVLKECERILKHGGKLMITTPNLNAIERVFWKALAREKKWHGLSDETHINLYSTFSLRNSVESTGLRILELKTPFHSLSFAANDILEKTRLGGKIWLLAEKP